MSPKHFSLWIMIKDMIAPCCGTSYGGSRDATDIQCSSSTIFCDFIPSHKPTDIAKQQLWLLNWKMLQGLSWCLPSYCAEQWHKEVQNIMSSAVRLGSLSPSKIFALQLPATSPFPIALLSSEGEKWWMMWLAWLLLGFGQCIVAGYLHGGFTGYHKKIKRNLRYCSESGIYWVKSITIVPP